MTRPPIKALQGVNAVQSIVKGFLLRLRLPYRLENQVSTCPRNWVKSRRSLSTSFAGADMLNFREQGDALTYCGQIDPARVPELAAAAYRSIIVSK